MSVQIYEIVITLIAILGSGLLAFGSIKDAKKNIEKINNAIREKEEEKHLPEEKRKKHSLRVMPTSKHQV